MVNKDANNNLEKEALQRYLLAEMLFSTNKRQIKNSHNHWTSFWQELLRDRRI